MYGTDTLYLILILVFFVLAAFFASSETGFFSLQRVRLEHLVDTRIKGAQRVLRMIQRPEKFLSVVLLGTNLANTAAAAMATALALKYWPEQGVLISTIAVTTILLIFSETIPKTFAARHPERLSLSFVRPLELVSWLFTPFVIVLSWIASGFTRLVGGTPVERSIASEEEIRTMISMGHKEGTVEEDEAKMLHRVFDFGDRPVREAMVPRPEVICIEEGSTITDFLALYIESPQSRFPVFRENMDNVAGILAIKDILMAQAKGSLEGSTIIDNLVRPAYFTPETKHISDLFAEMRDKNYQMAVVVDEFGGTAGIVSLSGLVEEIVGPVGDELAGIEKELEVINEYTFQVDGSMRIEEVNEEIELNLPEGDYETVAGFILDLLGYIPRVHEQLRYEGIKMVITEMRGLKIEKILITRESHATSTD